MDEKFKQIFNLIKKDRGTTTFSGDDIHMRSVAPYGIPTSIAELDIFLGARGGIPAAKIIEIWGKAFTGKSTLALHIGSQWQKAGGLVIFLDTEQAYSPQRAREIGCNPENIIKHEASTVEDIFNTIIDYLGEIDISGKRTKKGLLEGLDVPVLFIVDSITAVPTHSDVQGELENEARVGMEAKQIKRALRKVNPLLGELKCKPSIIFVNHAVSKIGGFGKQSDSGGGLGIKFYSSVRIELANISQLPKDKVTGERIGQKINVCVEKLKGAHLQHPVFTLNLLDKSGFDKIESLKLAFLATDYARRPQGSRTITILPGTEQEEQFAQVDFEQWVEQNKGFDVVYNTWRKWCIKNNVIQPWGGKDS